MQNAHFLYREKVFYDKAVMHCFLLISMRKSFPLSACLVKKREKYQWFREES